MRLRHAFAITAATAALACSNAGESLLLSISSTGVVKGLIFFDLDGNLAPSGGDDSVRNIHVKLVEKSSGDSVTAAVSVISGTFRMADVPVGIYRVVVDTAPLADTARVVRQDSTEVTVRPSDSSFVFVALGYPHVSIARARSAAVPLGRKVFIEGITLNSLFTFRDTTVYVQDTSAAIRAARVRTPGVAAQDSVRMRGTISSRAGQRTIEDVTVFSIASTLLPPALTVTSVQAASAVGGTRDARQLRVVYATITDTLPVQGGFRLMVNDSTLTGALEVLLDATAFPIGLVCPGPTCIYNPGKRFDFVGLATPTTTPGVWRLKPRSAADALTRP